MIRCTQCLPALVDLILLSHPCSNYNVLFLSFIYSAVYIKINTVFQTCVLHTIQRVMTEKQDLASRCRQCRALFQTNMPQDTYTCAVTLLSLMCLVFALVHEQVVYLKRTMNIPPQPTSSVLVIITSICSKLSHYFTSLSRR